jgi:hypothetical protein
MNLKEQLAKVACKACNQCPGEEILPELCDTVHTMTDAILEALRHDPHRRVVDEKGWIHIPDELIGKNSDEISLLHSGKGILVFIPDDAFSKIKNGAQTDPEATGSD